MCSGGGSFAGMLEGGMLAGLWWPASIPRHLPNVIMIVYTYSRGMSAGEQRQ